MLGTLKLESEYHIISKNIKHELECVDSMKDLGVVIDSCLNFETQLQEKINKANQTMGMIRCAFTFMDEDMFVCLFKAGVRPQFESPVESVHRRATKLISNLKNLT